jgi:hypothetical protein
MRQAAAISFGQIGKPRNMVFIAALIDIDRLDRWTFWRTIERRPARRIP